MYNRKKEEKTLEVGQYIPEEKKSIPSLAAIIILVISILLQQPHNRNLKNLVNW